MFVEQLSTKGEINKVKMILKGIMGFLYNANWSVHTKR